MDKLKNFVKKFDSLLGFLFIEVLAFVAFNLANVGEVFQILGFIFALALIPFVIICGKKSDAISFLLFAIPLAVFVFVMSFSPFSLHSNGSSIIAAVAFFLGTLGFIFAGFALKRNKAFNITIALYVIFGFLTLLLFISLVATIAEYGALYAAINNGKYLYYDGTMYEVSSTSRWLLGFTIYDVNIDYFSMYSVITASALGGLFFLSPKKDTKNFVIFGVIGFIGLLAIILLPSLHALYILIPTMVIIALMRFLPKSKLLMKILKWVGIVLLVLLGLFIIVFILNAQTSTSLDWLHNMISSNNALDKIFNTNHYSAGVKPFLIFDSAKPASFFFGTANAAANTGSFLLDLVAEGGIISFVAILVFLVLTVITLVRFVGKGDDKNYVKAIIVGFVFSLFTYATFFYPSTATTFVSYYFPFTREMPFLLGVFFIGYAFTASGYFKYKDKPILVAEEASSSSEATDVAVMESDENPASEVGETEGEQNEKE